MKHRKALWESCILILFFWAGWQALERANALQSRPSDARPYVKGTGYFHQGRQVALQPQKPGAGPVLAGRPVVSYAKSPLSFEPNQGQTDRTVRFLSHGRGYGLFLTGDEAVLKLQYSGVRSQDSGYPFGAVLGLQWATDNGPRTRGRGRGTADNILRLKLLNANQNATVTGVHELPGKVNYFLGNDPKEWRTNVPTYDQVRYRNVYPGIDLVYYGNQGGELEYDFVVAPGADPGAIALDVGAGLGPAHGRPQGSRLRIARDGGLVVLTEGGEVRFRKPLVYQEKESEIRSQKSGVRTQDSGFRSQESGAKDEIRESKIGNRPSTIVNRQLLEGHFSLDALNRVHFALGPYDHTRPLVIDPVLVYSTFLGGNYLDQGNGIAVDSSGNIYVTGQTQSDNFPTVNALQASKKNPANSSMTAFVAELNAAGSALVYSTYLGGSVKDQGSAIAVDSSGNAYLTGSTCSSDFPTVNPLQASLKGTCDGFVAELNTTGSALVYSTYLGGSGTVGDGGTGIVVDSSANAYVTGYTNSTDFPTLNPIQGYGGGGDAFLCKIGANGSAFVYSTYLGGSGQDQGNGIAVDASGDAYVTGFTYSSDFPTVNPLQAKHSASPYSTVFVAELNAAGSALVYSTYLGGSSIDTGSSIAVDSSGNAYVTGATQSTDFPTVNPLQAKNKVTSSGNGTAFVAKLNAGGSALAYSTYLGGSGSSLGGDQGNAITVDSAGNAYVTGLTYSSDFPTFNPIQASNNTTSAGGRTAFLAGLNTTGAGFVYSTYLGGSKADEGNGIAVGSGGNAYLCGYTYSPDFPTVNPIQATNGADYGTAFVAEVSPPPPVILSPASLNFGSVLANITSPEKIVTLSNISGGSLNLTSIITSGDFAEVAAANSCPYGGGLVAGGTTCPIYVTFTPTATGTRTGALTVTYSGQGSPQTVALNGTGIVSAASVSTNSLNYGGQNVGTSSAPQTVTVTNLGSVALSVSNVAISSGWTQSNDCLPSIPANSSCTVLVSFQPTVLGPQNGTLTFTDYASNSPQTVTLSGTGLAPEVSLSPTTLSFAGQTVSTTSLPQTVTLTNTGNGTLIPLIVSVGGDFAQSNTCAGSVAAGASCTISVTFTPTAIGTRNGTLKFTDDASDSPQTVSLTGTGEDFALAVPNGYSSSATVPAGQAATYTLTVVGEGGFNQPVTLTCGGYPTKSTCAVSPSSAAPGKNFSVIITTTATSAPAPPPLPHPRLPRPHALLVLGALLACLARAIRASRQGKAGRWVLYLPLAAGLLLVLALAGCGGSPAVTYYGTPPGSYTVTLTGTAGAGSAAVSHSLKLTLNVS